MTPLFLQASPSIPQKTSNMPTESWVALGVLIAFLALVKLIPIIAKAIRTASSPGGAPVAVRESASAVAAGASSSGPHPAPSAALAPSERPASKGELKAVKDEVAQVRIDVSSRLDRFETKLDSHAEKTGEQVKTLAVAIGRLEGRLDAEPGQ